MKNEQTIKKMSNYLHSLELSNDESWERIPRTLESLYNLMYDDVRNSNHIWALKPMRLDLLNKFCCSSAQAKHLIASFENYSKWYLDNFN